MSKTFKEAVEELEKAKSDLKKAMMSEVMQKSFWITFFSLTILISFVVWFLI
jgi:hypothetical protein